MICVENLIFNFSVWLRTGSNPADINRFQIHTNKKFSYLDLIGVDVLTPKAEADIILTDAALLSPAFTASRPLITPGLGMAKLASTEDGVSGMLLAAMCGGTASVNMRSQYLIRYSVTTA